MAISMERIPTGINTPHLCEDLNSVEKLKNDIRVLKSTEAQWQSQEVTYGDKLRSLGGRNIHHLSCVEIPVTNDKATLQRCKRLLKDNIKFKENNVHGLIFRINDLRASHSMEPINHSRVVFQESPDELIAAKVLVVGIAAIIAAPAILPVAGTLLSLAAISAIAGRTIILGGLGIALVTTAITASIVSGAVAPLFLAGTICMLM
ncbi:MAG: hypothetical protein H0X29_03675 [Parachlamydiaceae bacterium]|nr:hypothetical protein [Parachlamydiaceae bacterium]